MLRTISRFSWPAATAFAALVFGCVYALVNLSTEQMDAIGGILLALGGGTVAAFARAMIRTDEEQAEHEAKRARKRAARELDAEIREVLKSSAPPPGPPSTLTSADATPPASPAAVERRDRPPNDRPTGPHRTVQRQGEK